MGRIGRTLHIEQFHGPFCESTAVKLPALDTATVDRALGVRDIASGVYPVGIPRDTPIVERGTAIPLARGVGEAINSQATGNDRAAVTGDFVPTAAGVNPALEALRENGVEVTALHHILDDQPRLFFMHYWATGRPRHAFDRAQGGCRSHRSPGAEMILRCALAALALSAMLAGAALGAEPLLREGTIALPDAAARIDHMAVDLARRRLFVAELGKGSVDVIDLASGKVIHRIAKLDEPQGVAYVAKTDRLAVANGGDGTLRLYDGSSYAPRDVLKLGDDADNVRPGPSEGEVTVGYGSGALAVVDTAAARKVGEIELAAHPEGFQLLPAAHRAFVNVPDAHQIAVIDLGQRKQIARWSPHDLSANFPMALGPGNTVAVVFRGQSRLVKFDTSSGNIAATAATCGDADDVFFDAKRQRFYLSCGAGFVDVFAAGGLSRIGHIATARGARTSLYVPELDRLYVAARAGLLRSNASIMIYRAAP